MVVTAGRGERLYEVHGSYGARELSTNHRQPVDELGLDCASIDNDMLDRRRQQA
jgi:hypothetical protein